MAVATAIIIGLAIYGAYQSSKGSIAAGNAAKKAGDAGLVAGQRGQELENYNAAIAEEQATDAITRGKDEEARFRQGVKALIGSQRAGFAGQGVDVGSGSAVDVQTDAAYLGELDAYTIQQNAVREAQGFHVQAENARRRGVMDLEAGQNRQAEGQGAQTASRYQAAGTILGTASSLVAAKYGWGAKK